MPTDKKLALAFEFDNAPQELKEIADIHKENYLAMITAEKQVDLWNREKERSRREFDKSLRRFDRALEVWDPAGLQAGELKEAPTRDGE